MKNQQTRMCLCQPQWETTHHLYSTHRFANVNAVRNSTFAPYQRVLITMRIKTNVTAVKFKLFKNVNKLYFWRTSTSTNTFVCILSTSFALHFSYMRASAFEFKNVRITSLKKQKRTWIQSYNFQKYEKREYTFRNTKSYLRKFKVICGQ